MLEAWNAGIVASSPTQLDFILNFMVRAHLISALISFISFFVFLYLGGGGSEYAHDSNAVLGTGILAFVAAFPVFVVLTSIFVVPVWIVIRKMSSNVRYAGMATIWAIVLTMGVIVLGCKPWKLLVFVPIGMGVGLLYSKIAIAAEKYSIAKTQASHKIF